MALVFPPFEDGPNTPRSSLGGGKDGLLSRSTPAGLISAEWRVVLDLRGTHDPGQAGEHLDLHGRDVVVARPATSMDAEGNRETGKLSEWARGNPAIESGRAGSPGDERDLVAESRSSWWGHRPTTKHIEAAGWSPVADAAFPPRDISWRGGAGMAP